MKDEPRQYATAAAFRAALDARHKTKAQSEGVDLQRLRESGISFDRLLTRLFSERNPPWLLKGGYAMELRMRSACARRRISICLFRSMSHPNRSGESWSICRPARPGFEGLFRLYHWSAGVGLGCCTGRRCQVSGHRVIGRPGFKFHLDVGMGDAAIQPLELLEGRNCFSFFAGIPPVEIRGDFQGAAVCGKAACLHPSASRGGQ